jgi:hypothetical protein
MIKKAEVHIGFLKVQNADAFLGSAPSTVNDGARYASARRILLCIVSTVFFISVFFVLSISEIYSGKAADAFVGGDKGVCLAENEAYCAAETQTGEFVSINTVLTVNYDNTQILSEAAVSMRMGQAEYEFESLGEGAYRLVKEIAVGRYDLYINGHNTFYILEFTKTETSNKIVNLFSLRYDGNEAQSGSVDKSVYYYADNSRIAVDGNPVGLGKRGFVFAGFGTQPQASSVAEITVSSEAVVLYAQWELEAPQLQLNYTQNPFVYGDEISVGYSHYFDGNSGFEISFEWKDSSAAAGVMKSEQSYRPRFAGNGEVTCDVTVYYTDASSSQRYTRIDSVSAQLNIERYALQIKWSVDPQTFEEYTGNYTYDGGMQGVYPFFATELLFEDEVSLLAANNFYASAGDYQAQASLGGKDGAKYFIDSNDIYKPFIITKAVLLNNTALNAHKTYDKTPYLPNFAFSGFAADEDMNTVAYGSRFSLDGGAEQSVFPTLSDAGGYTVAYIFEWDNYQSVSGSISVEIEKRRLRILLDDKQSYYGDAFEALTYTVTSGEIAAGDDLDIIPRKDAGEGAGKYIISAVFDNRNYEVDFTFGVYTVLRRALIVKIDNKVSAYAEPLKKLSYTLEGGLMESDDLGIRLYKADGIEIGVYAITGTYENDNYEVSFIDGVYRIERGSLVIKISDVSAVYGEREARLEWTIESGTAMAGEDLGIILTREQGFEVGKYKIDGAASNPNYNFVFILGTYTVEKRRVLIEIDDKQSIYAQTEEELTWSVSTQRYGIIQGDELNLAFVKERGTDAGEYSIFGSFSNPNYDIEFTEGYYTIKPIALTIAFESAQSVYGDPFEFPDFRIADGQVVEGEDAMIYLYKTEGNNVGTYALRAACGNKNYTVGFVEKEYGIIPATLNNYTQNIQYFTYNGSHNTIALGVGGFKLEDDIGVCRIFYRSQSENFTEAQPRLKHVSDSGTVEFKLVSDNYETLYGTVEIIISPLSVGVVIGNVTAVEGEREKPLIWAHDEGVIGNDDLQITLYRASGDLPGVYVVYGSSANSDYDVAFTNGTYTINRAAYVFDSADFHYFGFAAVICGGGISPDTVLRLHKVQCSSNGGATAFGLEVVSGKLNPQTRISLRSKEEYGDVLVWSVKRIAEAGEMSNVEYLFKDSVLSFEIEAGYCYEVSAELSLSDIFALAAVLIIGGICAVFVINYILKGKTI